MTCCPSWSERAICTCGKQRGRTARRISGDLTEMAWGYPAWASSSTIHLCEAGFIAADFDPAQALLAESEMMLRVCL